MRTLCQHIFDLVQNSLHADAQNIHVIVDEDIPHNLFKIVVKDDGYGIKTEQLSKVKDPFFTTRPRNKRRVGLGLALMNATCERTNGKLIIESKYRHGTQITAIMEYDNIDRPPLGDLLDLFTSLMLSTTENKVIWTLEHIYNGKGYRLKNRMTMDELNILSFNEPGVRDKLYQLIVKKEEEIHK
jgi:hypothetical protein